MVALEDTVPDPDRRGAVLGAGSIADLQAAGRAAGRGRGASTSRCDFPSWNRTLAGAPGPPAVAGHVDPAAGARCSPTSRVEGLEHLRAHRRPGHLRRQPSEPHGRARSSWRRCRDAGARARGAGDGQGVLQGALLSRREHTWRQRFTNSLNYYLAAFFFNAFPLPQREAGRAADAAVHRRADRRRLVDPDLSRGRAVADRDA